MTDSDVSEVQVASYLEKSLSLQWAKEAEIHLRAMESLAGFSINLLHVVTSSNLKLEVKLAGALYFKNLMRRKWMTEDGVRLIPIEDAASIKREIIGIMTTLQPQIELQIAELISLIAELDFPHDWPDLVDELVGTLSQSDIVAKKPILLVAHSIFKRWRPLFRSDELFLEIKMVLDKFSTPFFVMLQEVDDKISTEVSNASLATKYMETLLCLLQLYYDFNCQDIPEFFEDHMEPMMKIVHKYSNFTSTLVGDASDDDEVDILIKCKTLIIELVSLYVTRYADVFEGLTGDFINSVWQQLVTSHVTRQSKYDLLVVKLLRFLALVARNPQYQSLFNDKTHIQEIIEKIILPNIYFRETDEESFEDEPVQFTRSDLEGLDFDSRRKAATDFLKELNNINAQLLTSTVMTYVLRFLDGSPHWRNKDTATYLFSSLATRGQVTHQGVAATNVLVDVIQYFTGNVAADLVNDNSHPILKMDAIKYIYTFRNQLTKEQLLTTIPLLLNHLNNNTNPVVYTYAAIAIEKLLEMTDNSHVPVFSKTDIAPEASNILLSLFRLIFARLELPEKLAENEFLIKCAWRIIAVSEDMLLDRLAIIEQLLRILLLTLKNPSNPKFSHYTFEAIATIIKFDLKNIVKYIDSIVPQLLAILSEDVQEFVPYTFQILAFLLESLPKENGLPETFILLIKPLLSPSVWEYRGNVPGITRLLIAILEQDSSPFTVGPEALTPLLGVFQKLISSKLNDNYGFDLLQLIIMNVPMSFLESYLNPIAILLLTRLKNARTDKYVKRFVLFLSTLCILQSDQNNATFPNAHVLNCDFMIKFLDSVQAGVFSQIYMSFMLPTLGTLNNLRDKKVVNLAVVSMMQCPTIHSKYPSLLTASADQIVTNIDTYEGVAKNSVLFAGGQAGNDIDTEAASFGLHFSKLVSIQAKVFDPVPEFKHTDPTAMKSVALNAFKQMDQAALLQLSEETRQKLSRVM